MTLIEGVGDEVIHFFLLLAVAFIALIAWWSTNLSERPLIRTVFIVERRTIRRAPSDSQLLRRDASESIDRLPDRNGVLVESKRSQSHGNIAHPFEFNAGQNENRENTSNGEPSSDIPPEDKSTATSEGNCEGNVSEAGDEPNLQSKKNASVDGVREQRDVSEGNESVGNANTGTTNENNNGTGCRSEEPRGGNIRIRLKYLNDDQKLVEGKLQEQLGDFKRRHFSLELAGRKLVRLIFKGQVLQEDTKTLQNCGFFDNCVVHCLIQSRTPPPSPNPSRAHNDGLNDAAQHWDLGNILFASLSLLLGLAWYGRFQYAQLYTATTTVTLVGLTGIFTVSLIGMYMPDTDGLRA